MYQRRKFEVICVLLQQSVIKRVILYQETLLSSCCCFLSNSHCTRSFVCFYSEATGRADFDEGVSSFRGQELRRGVQDEWFQARGSNYLVEGEQTD